MASGVALEVKIIFAIRRAIDASDQSALGDLTLKRCCVIAISFWAEAGAREASGASIKLPEELWQAAAIEQQKREIENPFVDTLDMVFARGSATHRRRLGGRTDAR